MVYLIRQAYRQGERQADGEEGRDGRGEDRYRSRGSGELRQR